VSILPVTQSASVILDSSGNGSVQTGPNIGKWNLTHAAINTSSAAKTPQCKLYMGTDTGIANLIDGTFVGSLNSTDNVSAKPIGPGEYIFAVWTGGDPGATATLTVNGTLTTGYR
jgi:hypothetical protein